MDPKAKVLSTLRADEYKHLDGSFVEHLSGTQKLLKRWGASTNLQDAGLYHAAYGTDGFDECLVSVEQRVKLVGIIGHAAEEIVYQYCACDRADFFAKIGQNDNPEFKNRFTRESYYLSKSMLKDFCELTAANEIEIAIDNPEFLSQHGAGLRFLFNKMTQYLSIAAQEKSTTVFGGCSA